MSQNVVMIKNLEQIDEKFSEKLYRENLFFKKVKPNILNILLVFLNKVSGALFVYKTGFRDGSGRCTFKTIALTML